MKAGKLVYFSLHSSALFSCKTQQPKNQNGLKQPMAEKQNGMIEQEKVQLKILQQQKNKLELEIEMLQNENQKLYTTIQNITYKRRKKERKRKKKKRK